MKRLAFKIHGDTQPQGRPRAMRMGKGIRMYDDPKSAAFKKHVQQSYNSLGIDSQLEGALHMEIAIYRKIPKSFSKKMRQMAIDGIVRPVSKPDADNLAKTFMDALNGLAYKDDSQIVTLVASKYYAEEPYAFIQIQTL